MAHSETLEQKTSKAILQQPIDIEVCGVKYQVAPPSTATLILASEAVSLMPAVKLDSGKVIEEVLSVAKECRPIGDVIAILILGAKHLKETVVRHEKRLHSRLFGLIRWETEEEVSVEIDRKSQLAKSLLEDLPPKELYTLFAEILTVMQIQDFFGLTTFLAEINLIRPTKVEEVTQSGR